MLTLLLIALLVILLIYKLTAQRYTEGGIPIIGNIPWLGCGIAFRRGGALFLREMRKKHGNIFQIRAGGRSLTFVFDEEFYKLFYKGQEHELSFYEGIKEDTTNFHFKDVLGDKTETYEERKEVSGVRPIRNFLQDFSGTFTDLFIHDNFPFALENVKKIHNVQENQPFVLDWGESAVYFTAVLAASIFGGVEFAHDPRFLSQIKAYNVSALHVMCEPSYLTKRWKKICYDARTQIRQVIDENLAKGNLCEFSKECFRTEYQATGRKYGIDEAGYTIFAMMFALTSNTTTALANCFTDVIAHPEAKRRVLEELEEVIVKDPLNKDVKDGNYIINQDMIKRLVYLEACCSETLRLFSPPLQIRKLQINLTSGDGKVLVPKDSYICTSPWIRHREPECFENGEVFDPTRWLNNPKLKRFSYLTFGNGRHFCLGKPLAETVVRYTIASLLLKYDVKLLKDETSSRNPEPKVLWFSLGVLKPAAPIPMEFTPKQFN